MNNSLKHPVLVRDSFAILEEDSAISSTNNENYGMLKKT